MSPLTLRVGLRGHHLTAHRRGIHCWITSFLGAPPKGEPKPRLPGNDRRLPPTGLVHRPRFPTSRGAAAEPVRSDQYGQKRSAARRRRPGLCFHVVVQSTRTRCYRLAVDLTGESELDPLPALRGRAWVFGDCIAAEAVLPPAHLHRRDDEVGAFAMAGIDPTFSRAIDRGDFVVAGHDFGAGAAHTLTGVAVQAAGVAAIIARSFGRTFLQAALNIGLPALVIEETGAIKSGDRLRVDIESHKIVNLSSGDRYIIRNLTDERIDILRAGGLIKYHRRRRQP